MASDITLESAMKAFFEHQMRSVYTAIPAVVMQVRNAEEGRVDVKPLVNMVFPDYEDLEWATIPNVPLIYPSSSTSAFTFPVKQGDTVLLVFNQYSIDVFKAGDGSPQPPNDFRTFNMRDAVAIPGLFPFGLSINKKTNRTLSHSTDDAVLAHNLNTSAECELRMKQDGTIEINGSSGKINVSVDMDGTLTTTGAITVGTGATGSFTTPLGQIVTVTDGIVTNII